MKQFTILFFALLMTVGCAKQRTKRAVVGEWEMTDDGYFTIDYGSYAAYSASGELSVKKDGSGFISLNFKSGDSEDVFASFSDSFTDFTIDEMSDLTFRNRMLGQTKWAIGSMTLSSSGDKFNFTITNRMDRNSKVMYFNVDYTQTDYIYSDKMYHFNGVCNFFPK